MPTWLGIDIGSANVKAVLVRSTYRKLSLVRMATAEVVAAGDMAAAIRQAVAGVLAGETQGVDATAVALEGSRAAIHRLVLPATAQKQLVEVLGFELEAQVPFDMEGAVFDWRLLEKSRDDGQLPIVAAVARVDDVRACIDRVREATGYEPERVAVGAFTLGALVPYVEGLGDGGTVAIVDIGAKASEILVLENGEPVFARTLSTGTEGLPATADRLARDIRVSFAGHRAQGGDPPTRVYLGGGGAFASGAQGFLSGSLDMPVHVLPPAALDTMGVPPEVLQVEALYAKALALALSLSGRGAGMNLRRGPLAFERGFAWVRERVPVLAGLAAVILVSFVFGAWARLHAVHKDRDALQEALGTVTKEVLGTEATTAEDAQDLLTKATALSDEDPMPHADAFDVMVWLSQAVPTTITHDVEEMDVLKGHVTLRGIVGSVADAQTIQSTLADDRCLQDVKITSTTHAVGSDRQKYVMEFEIRCPEDVKGGAKKKTDAAASGSPSAAGAGGK